VEGDSDLSVSNLSTWEKMFQRDGLRTGRWWAAGNIRLTSHVPVPSSCSQSWAEARRQTVGTSAVLEFLLFTEDLIVIVVMM
jgi:hypothetical protein